MSRYNSYTDLYTVFKKILWILQGKFYQGAFLFACLLNLKHIFLYIAPAIGIYLLRTCCIKTNVHGVPKSINLKSMFALGGIVVGVAAVSFGPFYQHIPQVCQNPMIM